MNWCNMENCSRLHLRTKVSIIAACKKNMFNQTKQQCSLWKTLKQDSDYMKVVIPVYCFISSKDLALSKIASRSRLTECIDIKLGSTVPALDRGFLSLFLSAIALIILGVKVLMSIPWSTCRAASKFPLWYSSLPNNALASLKFIIKKSRK